MAKYKLIFKKSVSKDLRKIPNDDVRQILNRIETLREDPRGNGCIKLTNQGYYRVRQGIYRIIYQIKDQELIVQVIKVSHRSNVYKSN